jgi:cytidylate kinase
MIDANDIEIYELTIDNGEIDIDEDVEVVMSSMNKL